MFDMGKLLAFFSVASIAVGQLSFKWVAQRVQVAPQEGFFQNLQANLIPGAVFLGTMFLYAVSSVTWVMALRTVNLSSIYVLNSISFLLVPFAAFLFFGEALPRYFVLGMIFVLVGIFLVFLG